MGKVTGYPRTLKDDWLDGKSLSKYDENRKICDRSIHGRTNL